MLASQFHERGNTQCDAFYSLLTDLSAFDWATTLTDAEEEQGLHAEELFLSDLQQDKLLGEVSHPYTVLEHAGDVHPMAGDERESYQIKLYLSHVPNTTGVP